MKYLVTGGTGFIGAHAVRALAAAGHEVTLFDIAPNREFLRFVLGGDHPQVNVAVGDVSDAFSVLHAMRDCGAERVVHLAALLSLRSDQNPMRALRVNCEGTLNIFEAALACNVSKVVWASSIGVFGTAGIARSGDQAEDSAIYLENDAPHRPHGVYGICKSFSERMANFYARHRGLNAIGLRFANTYGYGKNLTLERGTRVGFMLDLIDRPALDQASVVEHGDAVMDWVYVGDAARAVLLASETAQTRAVAVNVCGERRAVRDVAAVMRELMPNARIDVKAGRWGDDLHYDEQVAKTEIGYAPVHSLHAGLRLNINMLRAAHGLEAI
jgi:UDP-glucose 4-epimerase